MTVGLITAVYGGYDDVPHLPSSLVGDVDAVCVTDDQRLADWARDAAPGWRVVFEPRPGVHPNLAAKRAKMLPWEYTDAGVSIWMDAAFRIQSPTFVPDAMVYLDHGSPIAQWQHPWRECVYEEAGASLALSKYDGLPIAEQMRTYAHAGHPLRWGLWAAGLIVREHTRQVRMFGQQWLTECETWGYQDQLSEAPCLRLLDLRPTVIPGDHLHNPWLRHQAGPRHQ